MNIQQKLKQIEEQGLKRELIYLDRSGADVVHKGKRYLNFSSNDYLNFAADTRLKDNAKNSIDKWGIGATGSRLMSGSLEPHKRLEEKISQWLGYKSALVFGSGFLTNLGLISALCQANDIVLFDKLDHASLIDGIRMSGAKWKRYKHKNTNDLERLLEQYNNVQERIFIITDSVFSMDGDIAPVKEISKLAKKYNAILIVDEAHAIGIFGEKGAGICNEQKIKPDIITGTLSKALGSYGGFAVFSKEIEQLCVNKARSFIYSTALPAVCAATGEKAIDIIQEEKVLGEELLKKAKMFYGKIQKAGFDLLPFESQVIPVMIGDNDKTLKFTQALLEEELFVKAIRPPTVPKGTSRVRLSITLAHTKEELEKALEIIVRVGRGMGIIA